ncbi:MAG: hypothetical protein ACYDEE_17150 [Ignavibacteriaceae bacterium]
MIKHTTPIKLLQTRIRRLPDRIEVYVRQNHFKAGVIDLNKKVFISVERSPKNLFRLFRDPGLGINAEILEIILPRFGVERIQIPYLGKILETTASKWRVCGLVSPYGDDRIDKQIILSFDLINMVDAEKYAIREPEPNLFEEVAI